MNNYIVKSGGWWIFWCSVHHVRATSSTEAVRNLILSRQIKPGVRVKVTQTYLIP